MINIKSVVLDNLDQVNMSPVFLHELNIHIIIAFGKKKDI